MNIYEKIYKRLNQLTDIEGIEEATKVKKSLESGYPGPEAPAFPPDSWLCHRDFKNIL